jgi:hypothetical protein
MRRWEAFALAAQVQAAHTRYELCSIHLERARSEGHEVTVKDVRSGMRLALHSVRDWQEALHRREIEGLAQRARWAEPEAHLRRDLVAEYERLSADVGVTARPVCDPQGLCHAVEALLGRVEGPPLVPTGGSAPGMTT